MSEVLDMNGKKVNPEPPKKKRIFIMVEETGDSNGAGFQVYLGGDVQRLNDMSIPQNLLSPAEFWGGTIFNIAIDTLRKAGVIKTEIKPEGMRQDT